MACDVDEVLAEPLVRQPLFATFDVDGRLWVVQYLQYPEPAGIKPLSRDNFWRIVYDRLPKPPGQDVAGADRITIYNKNDAQDGDAKFTEVGDFVSGLNIATSVVPTTRGAWVLQPPYLLFYPDANGDLKADGEPEVHLARIWAGGHAFSRQQSVHGPRRLALRGLRGAPSPVQ